MSLYNVLFGVNPMADALLAVLGITRYDVPRFRDCYLKDGCIEIYTRTGGGNREEYQSENGRLHALPGFISDEDDDFDSTYAHFRFSIPPEFEDGCKLLSGAGADGNPGKAWADLLSALADPAKRKDPQVLAAVEKIRPVVARLEEALKKGESSVTFIDV